MPAGFQPVQPVNYYRHNHKGQTQPHGKQAYDDQHSREPIHNAPVSQIKLVIIRKNY
jgi:hypothetical protein